MKQQILELAFHKTIAIPNQGGKKFGGEKEKER